MLIPNILKTEIQMKNKNNFSDTLAELISLPGLVFVYLHAGAIALMSIREPAVPCCTLVQVDVLNVDIHAYHTSNTGDTHMHTFLGGGWSELCVKSKKKTIAGLNVTRLSSFILYLLL